MMEGPWDILILAFFVTAAIAASLVAAWLFRKRENLGPAGAPTVAALGVSSIWALAVPSLGGGNPLALLALSLTNLGWIWAVYQLFANDDRHTSVKPIRAVVMALCLVEFFQIGLIVIATRLISEPEAVEVVMRMSVVMHLLFTIGALVLVHNLYVGASPSNRPSLRWPALALALLWAYDLNFYTVAYLYEAIPETLFSLRGAVLLVVVAMIAVGSTQNGDKLSFQPSRSVTFQTVSLILIGAYLVAMVLLAQGMAYAGSSYSRLLQLTLIAGAISAGLFTLPSRKMRGWLRVTLAKHLFQHRYDYRSEWLRFSETMGGASDLPFQERAIRALADITDSQSGLLIKPDEHGALTLEARWQWPHLDVPAEALPGSIKALLAEKQYVVDLDDVREDRAEELPAGAMPTWLLEEMLAWAIVPLIHKRRLVGAVILSRPVVQRNLDWEDFDLLRVVGQQLASYLAEQAGQEALIEAHRFDEFNRRIAFVMHDIKNLASQLSLLARNAERHAENPDFRADMLVTLRNSAEKLNALLARLGRYGASSNEKPVHFNLGQLASEVVGRFSSQHPVQLVQAQECIVLAHREALEQALVHLVQNAIDASEGRAPVYVNVVNDGLQAEIEVVDSGEGMSADFIRSHLFKPFHSTKSGGFGIVRSRRANLCELWAAGSTSSREKGWAPASR